MQVEIIQKRGGVADYFAVLGIGERFEWQHTKKKAGMQKEHERNEELESEVDLMKRFYREIVEVDIVTKGFDIHETSTIASQGRNYPDEDRSQSSYDSANVSSRTNAMDRKEPILSTETLAISSDVDSSTARYSMLEWDGFTVLRTTCQAGRASGGEDQACLAKILLQEKSSNSMSLWSKSQIFNANLDPFFGIRGEILGQTIHNAEQTSLKHIGRKVTSSIRHQLAPLLHSHDQRLNRPSHGLQFLLAFRQRGPDEIDRPAIADLDLRFIRIHVDTIYSTRVKSEGLTSDTTDTKSVTLRRGIHTGVAMAARVAEASKQKILEKYREKYDSPKKIISLHNLNHIDVDHSDAILVSLEDLLTIPGSFDEWVIPEPFQRIKIPAKAKSENLSSFRGGRKTHVLPLRMNDYRSLDQVLVEDTTTQASDPSGIGVEAYFDGSSFVLSPASSAAGTSDISVFHLSSAGTVNNMDTPLLHDDLDLASSFEVLEPSIYMPQVMRTSDLTILSSNSQSEPYEYIPVLVTRRQRVGDEERYHEDPAVVDLAVTFRDSKGDVILPQMLEAEDDDDKEMEFNILDISPWSDYLDIGDSRSEQTLGSPAIILRRNRPLGLADVEFSTRVLDRFPQKNYKGFPLPEEELPMFCYPTGCRLIRARYSDCPLPQYFGFVVKVSYEFELSKCQFKSNYT
jgi:uDENN domain